jgi:hypothetical protein
VWVRAKQRLRFGVDRDLIWASRANAAAEQLSREQLYGKHLSWNLETVSWGYLTIIQTDARGFSKL